MNQSLRLLLAYTAIALLGIIPATAQQITGTPGSPSATTTIDGNYIPNPPPAFGGEINLNAKDSKTWWPPNITDALGQQCRSRHEEQRGQVREAPGLFGEMRVLAHVDGIAIRRTRNASAGLLSAIVMSAFGT